MTDLTGEQILDEVEQHFGAYICTTDDADLSILTLWVASTHVANELYTSPRLLLDSIVPGSGKTTVLDHLHRLGHKPVQAASLSSPALMVRLLEKGVRTILLDEVDRSLSPEKPGVGDLVAILNSGYRRGATRPVLVPAKGGEWEPKEMPTFAPVAMAGNSPRLPDDTRSRCIRILLMPDIHGTVRDSDWEVIEEHVAALRDRLVEFAESIREQVAGMDVELPPGCIGRSREKWRPLKRVAVAAGGHWPAIADELIVRDLAQNEAEDDAGLKGLPPGMVMIRDLCAVWPDSEDFMPTEDLVRKLVLHNPEMWSLASSYGKALTARRLGQLVSQASKVTSSRPGGRGPRGYLRSQLEPVWHRVGASKQSGASGSSGASGGNSRSETVSAPAQPVLKGNPGPGATGTVPETLEITSDQAKPPGAPVQPLAPVPQAPPIVGEPRNGGWRPTAPARDWILLYLDTHAGPDGWVLASEVYAAGQKLGYSPAALQKAAMRCDQIEKSGTSGRKAKLRLAPNCIKESA
ncbi:DUF3631 domain-containing protein [Tsukamurella tyrosinosolvens]|uniref:DUF3631 domain-containing protein n=1 Tax=Tsukamurella tyrosinosolvens TaxID=57704 RepID=UPI003F4A4BDE